ncbi:hypothetical protein M7I_2147 [Glarea lozoyensis 74030]|uniref:Uncharacterized protein n=1 Tax=Glarea lozoyensis (strain ATCC 74030 / MF5533) TaxID=1104152 RepID=H0EI02_GLAL7|nr:hypothetical protein M7I_2147 [Glarea lozoyensis 74030]
MEPPTIKIELEVDNLKNQELGSWPSKPAVAEDGFTNLEAGDAKGSGSYLSVQLTTIQAIDSKHSLFVWHTVYHPGPVGIGVTPCTERKSAVEVDHAFVIEGSVRGIPQKHTCVWTVEENKATERGVPSEVRFAALIEHSQPIICEVSASGWTAGGLKPSHHLKTKTPKEARSLEVDPSQYKGKLVEFELGQDISQYQELLSSWTGKVEGALLEFDQTVVGP